MEWARNESISTTPAMRRLRKVQMRTGDWRKPSIRIDRYFEEEQDGARRGVSLKSAREGRFPASLDE